MKEDELAVCLSHSQLCYFASMFFSNFLFLPEIYRMKIHDLLHLPTVLCKQWWEAE